MLFAYNDDGRLEVVVDVADARRRFASRDIETGAVRLFDEAGRELTARFPQRSERRILGFKISEDHGPFELEPSPEGSETLLEALGPLVVLMPNQWFADVDAVKAHLRKAART
jgi:hypothetical protein